MKNIIKTIILIFSAILSATFTYKSLINIEQINWKMSVSIVSCVVGLFVTTVLILINVELREKEAHELIFKDILAGSYNQRMLYRLFNEYSKSMKHFSLVYLMIDDFIQINDTKGHKMGDLALSRLVYSVLRSTKGTDRLIHFGGDGFILILDGDMQEEDIDNVIKRIRHNLDKLSVTSDILLNVSVSAGYSRFPTDSWDLSTLLDIAYKGMYRED